MLNPDGDRVSSDSSSDKDRERFPRRRVLLIVCSFGLFILMAVLTGMSIRWSGVALCEEMAQFSGMTM